MPIAVTVIHKIGSTLDNESPGGVRDPNPYCSAAVEGEEIPIASTYSLRAPWHGQSGSAPKPGFHSGW